MIPSKSSRITAKTGKLFFSLFFSDFYKPKLVGEDLLGRERGVGEEGSPNFDEFAGFRPVFQISPNSDEISPESPLRAFWKKQIIVEGILE